MNIYVLNAVSAGLDTVQALEEQIPIAGFIGLSPAKNKNVSGFVSMANYAKQRNISYYEAQSYTLDDPRDREEILRLDIDFLLVVGWQRLVPGWLISHTRHAVFGSHGSPFGITQGRGRSPQNWALMMGCSSFSLSIFKIDEGIDSGLVADTATFELTDFDDIKSSYQKASLLTAQMYRDLFAHGYKKESLTSQNDEPAYLPQRLPEDGALDWTRDHTEIDRFVRALSRPYPGAFTQLDKENTLTVWKTRPFEISGFKNASRPGEVLFVFENKNFVVATGAKPLLIEDYEAPITIYKGMVLPSVSFKAQMEKIFSRHREKYPNLPISPQLLNYAN